MMVERFETLRETMRRRAKAAVAFFVPLLELKMDDVHTFFSFSSSRTFSFRFSFSFLRRVFSVESALIWSSRFVTYSFFFFRLMHADSLFLIILCCRFRFRTSSVPELVTVGRPATKGLQKVEEEEEDAKLDTGSVFTISGVALLAAVVFV